ncbi:hypothetical protein LZ30DRAFT_147617 [Colletotrichum cereale]|nr:hypothetical protein LZ30DRAFT_147617 [Colletotrichum cereale]
MRRLLEAQPGFRTRRGHPLRGSPKNKTKNQCPRGRNLRWSGPSLTHCIRPHESWATPSHMWERRLRAPAGTREAVNSKQLLLGLASTPTLVHGDPLSCLCLGIVRGYPHLNVLVATKHRQPRLPASRSWRGRWWPEGLSLFAQPSPTIIIIRVGVGGAKPAPYHPLRYTRRRLERRPKG